MKNVFVFRQSAARHLLRLLAVLPGRAPALLRPPAVSCDHGQQRDGPGPLQGPRPEEMGAQQPGGQHPHPGQDGGPGNRLPRQQVHLPREER